MSDFKNSEIIRRNKECCNAAETCKALGDHTPTRNIFDRWTFESATDFGSLLLVNKPVGVFQS